MQRLHDFILNMIFKSSIVPLILVELLLIFTIFVLGFLQEQNNEALVQKMAAQSFEEVAKQVTARMNNKIEGVEKDATALRLMLESLYEETTHSNDTHDEYRFEDGFFIRKNNEKATVYTTNLTHLDSQDKNALTLLSRMELPVDALMRQHQGIVDSAWINLGKNYSLYYPKINVKDELSPNLDPTQQGYYFKADLEHNPEKKTLFIPHFQEPWAISLGQIGSVVSPIYVQGKMLGVVGMTLSVENTKVLSGISLPFNAYVVLTDKEGRVLFASDEKAFNDDFSLNSFSALYAKGRVEPLGVFTPSSTDYAEYLFFQQRLYETGLELTLVAKKSDINHDVNAVYRQTRQYGVISLILIMMIHLILFVFIRKKTKAISQTIATPIGDIAQISEQLFQEKPLVLQESPIEEFETLQNNLQKAHKRLLEQLYYDDQTQLPNLNKLHKDISETSTLILVSVDNYKMVKNIYGPNLSHEVLMRLVSMLRSFPRSPMRLYRIYNDTFALLSEAKVHLQSELGYLYDRLAITHIELEEFDISLNYSLSLALPNAQSKLPLFSRADIALYEAKNQRFRKYLSFDEKRNEQALFELNQSWAKRFQQALHEHRVVPFFQPIYHVQEQRISKFETLVRMIDKEEVISPFNFLNVAKQMGKIADITLLMLREVFKVSQKYPEVEFSVNTSFEDFEEANLLHEIEKMLKTTDVHTDKIIIEILETGTYRDENSVIHTILALKKLGFKIAIDDFGAGNSNFAHLMLMQVDYIKIDGQFIKGIVEDQQSQNITKTINDFAHMAGAETVAEFVSDGSIFDKVKDLGIDFVQGNYICEPREASQIEEMLSIRER